MCCNGFRILLMFSLAALSFILNSFMPAIPVILWYLLSINIFTFFLFIIDKYYSLKDRERVPEMSLYFFSIAGGVFGAFMAMFVARHKIKKRLFLSFQSFIMLIWIVSIYYVLSNLKTIQNALQGMSA